MFQYFAVVVRANVSILCSRDEGGGLNTLQTPVVRENVFIS